MNLAMREKPQTNRPLAVLAVLLVIVSLLFSRFMARSITLPIQKLRDSMEKVQEGDFSISDVVVDSDNEIGSLTKSFDVMTHRIQELMEQNVYEQEQKRKSELKALQSQINPHFHVQYTGFYHMDGRRKEKRRSCADDGISGPPSETEYQQ